MELLDYGKRVHEADRIASIARVDRGGEVFFDTDYSREVAATLALVEATLALAAATHDGPPPTIGEAPAPVWARVELFGHSVTYGLVVEVERFGRRWLEVTAPATWKDDEVRDGDPDVPEQSKLYHPNAVYALTELEEQEVRTITRRLHGYDIPRPRSVGPGTQRTMSDDRGRVHVAEFRSKCAACGDDINEGDEIVLDPDDDWIHIDCEES